MTGPTPGHSQSNHERNIKTVESLISSEAYPEALDTIQTHIEQLFNTQNYFEATDYVYYLGKVTSRIENSTKGEKTIIDFATRLHQQTENPKILRKLHLEMGSFYEFLGQWQPAIKHNLQALEYTRQMPDKNGELLGMIYSNVSVYYDNAGNIPKSTEYNQKALSAYDSYKNTSRELYYATYNSLGALMWYSSKIDSTLYYYQKAGKILSELKATPRNQYLRPAILQNNMAAIHSILGNMEEALAAMQLTISHLNAYLKEDIPEVRRDYAREFLVQAIDNYGGLYKDLGNFQKARDLIDFSYQQKIKNLDAKSPEISKGKILLGQIHLALKDYEKAEKLLSEGIFAFENSSNNAFWLAASYYYLAILCWETGKMESAKSCFEKSEVYYKNALGQYYDENYLDFIIHAAHFYAENGNKNKALELSQDAYDYIIVNQGHKTLLQFYQTLNLADIHYELNNFRQSLDKCFEALSLLEDTAFIKNNNLSQLQIISNKPEAILLKVKSELKLHPMDDQEFIKEKFGELQEAISIIEQQKVALIEDSGISILLADNNDVFEWAKSLALNLYNSSKEPYYIDYVLSLHESMIYNKIRNRLNSKTSLQYANLPNNLSRKEQKLKEALNAPIEDATDLDLFIKTQKEWQDFLNELKTDFPKYYTLKYATISKSLGDISSRIQDKTTIVRYAFTGEQLYAFVLSKSRKEIIKLDHKPLKKLIPVQRNPETFIYFHDLYKILWEPLEEYIQTDKVIIIPDQTLFNVSFESFTPKKVGSARELANHCLLNEHTISYHYSLFLLNKDSKTIGYDKSFVAFAPEFNDRMKDSFRIAIADSTSMDTTYVKLLPQPFSVDLAKQYSRVFKGTYFANEKASKSVFLKQAGEHKIIHIGTHAQSNNVSPELSRLIFAKNKANDDNSLYTYEIYNENLNANLAILTACETGKPTYQAGEGMISLAHAFNYAGSESILTSLWEIDEQSSVQIVTLFYENLVKGRSKDEALRLAKLDYISQAKGRTIAPDYWAGLILIGDTSPIDISTQSYTWWILAVGLLVVLILMARKFYGP